MLAIDQLDQFYIIILVCICPPIHRLPYKQDMQEQSTLPCLDMEEGEGFRVDHVVGLYNGAVLVPKGPPTAPTNRTTLFMVEARPH